MKNTKIQWTDETWNVLRGCSVVSPGCANCYAAEMAARFSGPGQPYEGLATREGRARWTGEVRLVPEKLDAPIRWQRPRLVFVNSMSDVFHENVPDETIAAIFGVMALAPRHTFQILTKRARRMRDWFRWYEGESGAGATPFAAIHAALEMGVEAAAASVSWASDRTWPLRNVWLGVSAEDQERADERIPRLLETPAAVRWVSAEPLLGPVDFARIHQVDGTPRLDWIVVGGESGARARPFDLDWCHDIVRDCRDSRVPVFVKQMGELAVVGADSQLDLRRGDGCWPVVDTSRGKTRIVFDGKGGEPSAWPAVLQVREWPRGFEV